MPLKTKIYIMVMISIIVIAVLLGYWQVERGQWKSNLIAHIAMQKKESPLLFNHHHVTNDDIFRIVNIVGRFVDYPLISIPNQIHDGKGGRHIYGFFRPKNNTEIILVNLGFYQGDQTSYIAPNITLNYKKDYLLQAQIRAPFTPNMFTPDNSPERQQYYYIDPKTIADHYNMMINPFIYYMLSPQLDKNLKQIGANITLRNNHQEYAIIWFSLAFVALLVICLNYYFYVRNKKNV